MNVIIAGSRTIKNYDIVKYAINASGFVITNVINGAANGVDKLSTKYAIEHNISYKEFPAEWYDFSKPCIIGYHKNGKPYNKVAGNKRNKLMAKHADALIAIWDGKSKGMADMIAIAKSRNLQIYVHIVYQNDTLS